MKIIVKGVLPKTYVARVTCGNCNCLFEVTREEATLKSGYGAREPDYYEVTCPMDGCNRKLSISATSFKSPTNSGNSYRLS